LEKIVLFNKTIRIISIRKQLCTIEYKHFNKGLIDNKIILEKYYKEFIELFNKELIELALLKH
jgi:hypothetical protein